MAPKLAQEKSTTPVLGRISNEILPGEWYIHALAPHRHTKVALKLETEKNCSLPSSKLRIIYMESIQMDILEKSGNIRSDIMICA